MYGYVNAGLDASYHVTQAAGVRHYSVSRPLLYGPMEYRLHVERLSNTGSEL